MDDCNDADYRIEMSFYPNRRVRSERVFRNGLLHGPAVEYTASGRLKSVRMYRDNTCEAVYRTTILWLQCEDALLEFFGRNRRDIYRKNHDQLAVIRRIHRQAGCNI